VVAPQNDIKKLVRRIQGSVLAETTRMGSLRSTHLEKLIEKLNMEESGDYEWEPVHIQSDKIRRKSGKIECRSMDVVLTRKPSRRRHGSNDHQPISSHQPMMHGQNATKSSQRMPEWGVLTRETSVDDFALAVQSKHGIYLTEHESNNQLHFDCFVGSELTTWLMGSVEDIGDRKEVVVFAAFLMD
jgi:hypothetical protein